MRPVTLDMRGFAAFREPSTVDFTGAQYFVLVGPTGSGKSTVIDALTFALYGSVPRWDDRGVVRLALAPSVNRGVVRLVFDVADRRYVVARELRRSAKGGVTVRNARLERLLDPDDPDGPTDPIAADSGVTKAVEDLLGLPFDQFCQCVVLPQGDFAEFLHAKPAARQQMLTRLLGLGVYETVAKRANREAAAAQERADVLGGQLQAYADATDEAVVSAEERVRALAALAERVQARLPVLAAVAQAVQDATALVTRLDAERSALAQVAVPVGVADLDVDRRAAETAVETARSRVEAAEDADTRARAARRAAPDRGPLERVRRHHAELATARGGRPTAEREHLAARTGYDAAVTAVARAAAASEDARTARDTSAAALATTRERAQRLGEEHARLTELRAPAGLDVLAARLGAADEELADAQKALDGAEAREVSARDDLAAAPDRGPLERVRDLHAALAAALAAQPRTDAAHAAASRARADATAALAQARGRLDVAREHRERAAHDDLAAALRPALVAGQPCPVCEQVVATLPSNTARSDLAAADAAMGAAERALDAARDDEGAAAAEERATTAERDRLADEIERQRSALRGAPATPEATAAALAALDVLRTEALAAGVALRAARDPLVPHGAPPLGDDVHAGWAALIRWAGVEASRRASGLRDLERAVAGAEGDARFAAQTFTAAEATASERRAAETAAARAEQRTAGALATLDERIAELRRALDGEPDGERAADALAELDALDAAVGEHDTALLVARTTRTGADGALAGVLRALTAGWDALRRTRDPLVALGAPAVTAPDLLTAWTDLTGWSAQQAGARDRALPEARAAAEVAVARQAEAESELAGDLEEHGVEVPRPRATGGPRSGSRASGTAAPGASPPGGTGSGGLAARAPAAVAEAAALARGARDRIAERRGEAAQLRADRDAAASAHQVARMLGNLLRSDNFPRWLVASALDVLVADASVDLAELSGGQFELTHADGEFLVVDHADADAQRPVKTLSGGETFQASLALALALSAQMATLAADGAARLESIFLDEGFGTLDEANLEVVAGTLENLATRGDRMVGVITHVPALAERVPVRFTVSRDGRTASVVREPP